MDELPLRFKMFLFVKIDGIRQFDNAFKKSKEGLRDESRRIISWA